MADDEHTICGARHHNGGICYAAPVIDAETGKPRNGRCARHGGRSTGARTEAGRRRLSAAMRLRWAILGRLLGGGDLDT